MLKKIFNLYIIFFFISCSKKVNKPKKVYDLKIQKKIDRALINIKSIKNVETYKKNTKIFFENNKSKSSINDVKKIIDTTCKIPQSIAFQESIDLTIQSIKIFFDLKTIYLKDDFIQTKFSDINDSSDGIDLKIITLLQYFEHVSLMKQHINIYNLVEDFLLQKATNRQHEIHQLLEKIQDLYSYTDYSLNKQELEKKEEITKKKLFLFCVLLIEILKNTEL